MPMNESRGRAPAGDGARRRRHFRRAANGVATAVARGRLELEVRAKARGIFSTVPIPAPVTDPIAARYARRDPRPAIIAFWLAITALALVATATSLSLPMITSG
jgi:hypothetical protein